MAADAGAADVPWSTIATAPYLVKSRRPPGSKVDEVMAEGDLKAPVKAIQDTLLDPSSYPKFMPYVKECHPVLGKQKDGSYFVYTRLEFPIVPSRDHVVQTWVDEKVKPNGKGKFRSHWSAAPDALPPHDGSIRVKLDEGSWTVTPAADGKTSHVVYRFRVDPGGDIPAFAAAMGNRQGVPDTLSAVEKEAQRRAGR